MNCCGEKMDWAKTQRRDHNGNDLVECLVCGNAFIDVTEYVRLRMEPVKEFGVSE